uniref:G-protein coupled receptors family 1 profile domain-containing protein n=1 Tax=Suricata suricatta TaxID=37032 RepID=A0A673VIA3_SURSU
MGPGNDTRISEFLLLGFSESPKLQPLIFGLFISMYLITLLGNLIIILVVSSDSHLHMPMYFFLANLSLTDICFISTTIPKMLLNIQTQRKVITYEDSICHPLHYTVIMNPWLCGLALLLVCWITSILHSLLQTSMVLQVSFCTEVEIPHFLCELNQLIKLACSDTFLNNLVMYLAAMLMAGGPLVGILYSYSKIVSSLCRISSAQGKYKYKAFSTCGSHLSVVSLFYGTSLGVYLSSTASQNSRANIASVMFTVVTPMLNPFIYGLRNRDIKQALRKLKLCSKEILILTFHLKQFSKH